eukprot:1190121-Prorocentrum_minimum.AAC.7
MHVSPIPSSGQTSSENSKKLTEQLLSSAIHLYFEICVRFVCSSKGFPTVGTVPTPFLDVARPRQAIGQAERRERSASGRRTQGPPTRWEEAAHRQGRYNPTSKPRNSPPKIGAGSGPYFKSSKEIRDIYNRGNQYRHSISNI